jgi:hypothetical protein
LKGRTEKAARALLALLKSKNESVRRLTAVAILKLAMRIHEGRELEDHIRRLEETVGAFSRKHKDPRGAGRDR